MRHAQHKINSAWSGIYGGSSAQNAALFISEPLITIIAPSHMLRGIPGIRFHLAVTVYRGLNTCELWPSQH